LYIEKARVDSIQTLVPNTYLLKVFSPLIASKIKPGQFCNIKVSETDYPLLRRPFSICEVDGNYLHFMFDVHGEGTRILSSKIIGDEIDILGEQQLSLPEVVVLRHFPILSNLFPKTKKFIVISVEDPKTILLIMV